MKVLIIGLGSIAQKHIASILKLVPDTLFYALRSNINSINKDNIENIYDINDTPNDINFIIISNPTSYHKLTIEKLLENNIPMFIEKPAFHSLNGVDELVKSVDNSNLVNYVACNFRFHPCIEYLKSELPNRNKFINEINVYCGSYLPDWRIGNDFKKNYSSIIALGGGVHLDLIHEIDYVIWLLGKPKSSNIFLSNKSYIYMI